MEWYLDGMAQCSSGMTYPRTPGVLELPRMTAGRYTPRKSNWTDSTAISFSPMIFAYFIQAAGSAPTAVITPHTSAGSLGGAAKGLGVSDFDLAHLRLRHLRAALADAERGERNIDSLGVRPNLLL